MLYDIPFRYSHHLDKNRVDDAEQLRFEFLRDFDERAHFDSPISVLEVLVALAKRCEDNIMHDPDYGDRTHEWFWEMITNLGLDGMKNRYFDEEIVEKNVFKAGDLNEYLQGFQVLNPDVEICHMEPTTSLKIELTIEKGRGYVPSDENKKPGDPIGVIAIDSIHTPIKNVQMEVNDYRVEQKTDYEKLTFDIQTDGSIHPKEALKEAATILIQHFMLFSDERISLELEPKQVVEEFDRQLLKTKLIDLDLSVRALNCLKAAEVETLGDLVSYNKADLLKFRNFGKKSLIELENLVASKNLDFGMNISKYKLDKE